MADDARTVIRNLLTTYGLAELVPWAMNKLTSGASGDQVRLEMRDQPAYRQRFRAIFERERRGLPPISADYVLEYERQRSSLLRAYGLPDGFYDQPDDAVRDLVNDVSVAELQTRVVSGFARLQATDPVIRDEFQRQNNLTDGQLAAFFLDPDRALPLIDSLLICPLLKQCLPNTHHNIRITMVQRMICQKPFPGRPSLLITFFPEQIVGDHILGFNDLALDLAPLLM